MDILRNEHIDGEYKEYDRYGGFIWNRDIVTRAVPKLRELAATDKDGLISINNLNPIVPGIFREGNYFFFANKYFRRSASYFNSINVFFFNYLFNEFKNDEKAKVSIDFDGLGLISNFEEELEHEFWRGPSFPTGFSDIKNGVTVYNNAKYSDYLFPIRKSEFWWKGNNRERTFECEEIVLPANEEQICCRFAHSIIDCSTRHSFHLDGAVKLYSKSEMQARNKISIDKTGRETEYIKLWRVDDSISPQKWEMLISLFFYGNEQIREYFEKQ